MLPLLPAAPAKVVITPVEDTFRMIRFASSAMKRSPEGAMAIANGERPASVACPLSPEAVCDPFPATVLMTPDASTRRTRLLPLSQM